MAFEEAFVDWVKFALQEDAFQSSQRAQYLAKLAFEGF